MQFIGQPFDQRLVGLAFDRPRHQAHAQRTVVQAIGAGVIGIGAALGVAVFVTKSTLLVLVMMWLRWSLPRLRIDQVMTVCLKYFLPVACGLVVGVCGWQLLVPAAVRVMALAAVLTLSV